jgi:uncharacterized protein
MSSHASTAWIAFAGRKCIARGSPREVAPLVKAFADANPDAPVLIFDALTSRVTEMDLRGTVTAVLRRLPQQSDAQAAAPATPEGSAARGPGRPRLGVVAREVTLLPRHWDWLAGQPGGASVALRKLVEHAQRASRESDRVREARESAYRFMHAMAGNEPGFEDASRSLFADDIDGLRARLARWPRDIRDHALALAEQAGPKLPVTDVGPVS